MLSTNAYHKLSKYSCIIVKLIQKQVKNCKTYLTYVTSYISFRNRKRVRHIINHTKVSRHSPEFGDLNSCCLLKCLITEAKKLLLANLFYVPYGEVAISPGLLSLLDCAIWCILRCILATNHAQSSQDFKPNSARADPNMGDLVRVEYGWGHEHKNLQYHALHEVACSPDTKQEAQLPQ